MPRYTVRTRVSTYHEMTVTAANATEAEQAVLRMARANPELFPTQAEPSEPVDVDEWIEVAGITTTLGAPGPLRRERVAQTEEA